MNGFLPLMEAFLAFALTMLALSTAVSALLGVWIRIFRWRSFGLRSSIETVYDLQIEPRLRSALSSPPTPNMRLEFIADMTFNLNEQAGIASDTLRGRRLAELGRALDRPEPGWSLANIVRYPRFWIRVWHSLRFGVDQLPESQYRMRLDVSHAGKLLAAALGASRWQAELDWLTEHFTEVGVVATESFRRRASVRTVLIGLALAFIVNVDAFNLLNTYMSSEEARQSVIAQQDQILALEIPDAGRNAAVFTTDAYQASVDSAAASVREAAASIAATAVSDPELEATLQQAVATLEQTGNDLEIASGAAAEIESAIAKSQGIAASLTDRFPVGWDAYPNCASTGRDLRCARLGLSDAAIAAAGSERFGLLKLVAGKDPSGVLTWFLGVLITGLMVGLGAPFWIQAVDRLLAVRKTVADVKAADGAVAAATTAASAAEPAGTATPATLAVATGLPAGGANARQASDAAIEARHSNKARP